VVFEDGKPIFAEKCKDGIFKNASHSLPNAKIRDGEDRASPSL
jgi:hypothetical protein